MTMIAAFRISGVPVLIGDFLLTDNQTGTKHVYLPTKPDLSQTVPKSGHRRVCGIRKKIHKIGEQLAVGFTGSLAPGAHLMKSLYERFGNASVTLGELTDFLEAISFPGKKETELVGWICAERPLCFDWKGLHPTSFKLVESVFSGSGGKHFLHEVMRADRSGSSPEFQTALQRAIYIGTCQAGKVLMEELTEAKNIEHAYGFGAEVMVWDGAKFSYVEKVAFAFWNIVVGKNNELMVSPSNVSAIYRNCDVFSVVQVSHIGPKESPAVGLEAKNTYVHVITPIHDDMPSLDARTVGCQSFDSNLWFSGFRIANPAKSGNVTCSMVSECREGIESFTSFRNGELSLNLGQLRRVLPHEIFN